MILTAANSKAIKDTDARAQAGIKLASDKANEADQHAIDAGNKATMAQTTAQQATTRIQTVETVVSNIDQYKASNQTEIRFKPGQTMLSKNAKDALDEMAECGQGSARLHHRSAGLLLRQGPGRHHQLAEDGRVRRALPRAQPRDPGLPHMANAVKGQRGYIIEVQGFSSGRGQIAIQNSQKMAESVVRYMVLNHEIPVYRIYLVGMGNAPVEGTDAKHISGGRVEISLLKNDLEQLSSNSSAPMAAADQQQQPK